MEDKKKELEKEDIKDKKVDKKEKKSIGKIIGLIVALLVIVGFILLIVFYIIPKVKDEGIEGLISSTKLSEEEQKYFDLFYGKLEEYKDDDDYQMKFFTIRFEDIDAPVVVATYEYQGDINRFLYEKNKVDVLYVKDDKVVTKEFGEGCDLKLIYNVELGEYNYYILKYEDIDNKAYYTHTLLKDIVIESENPYSVKLAESDQVGVKDSRYGKVWMPKSYVNFIDGLEEYYDNDTLRLKFYRGDDKYFKKNFKEALKMNLYLKDVISDHIKDYVNNKLTEYGLKPGQRVLDVYDATTGEVKENSSSNSSSGSNSESSGSTSKCNTGFVYVSDDGKCYNVNDEKPMDTSCKNGYVNSPGGCAKKVDGAYCDGSNDQYEMYGGNCIDKYTDSSTPMDCPSGYDILWGEYGGQTFNGGCYRKMNPNN